MAPRQEFNSRKGTALRRRYRCPCGSVISYTEARNHYRSAKHRDWALANPVEAHMLKLEEDSNTNWFTRGSSSA